MLKKKFHINLYLLLTLLFAINLSANTIQHCDSLIKQGVDAMWKKEHVKSLELLTEARNLAEKNHWYEQVFLATNNIGANYFTMLDYGEALNYYLESYTIAVKELDPQHEMVVLNNIAIIYTKERNFEKAEEYFKKAYEIAKEKKDSLKIGLYAMNLGGVANETNRLEEAKKYIIESIPLLKQEPHLLVLAEICLAENELLKGNTTMAREKAQELYTSTDNLDYNDTGISLMLIIVKSYLKEGKYNQAITAANKILTGKPNLENKKTVYTLLADIYFKDKTYDKALQYKDSVLWAEVQLNDIKNGKLLETSKVKFEMQDYKNQIALNKEKLNTERKTFYSIIAAIVALVIILVLILRNRSVKLMQKKLVAERNEKAIALELAQEKNENLLLEKQIQDKENKAKLEQERLKNEIESRNRELSAKALYLSQRNTILEDILTSLGKIPELSKNESLAGHIKTLKSHLKDENEWENFLTHFEEVNQGYITRLKTLHPSLNANDVRFICYVYMNLSNKEIASMLNITVEACRKRKERIAAKLELPDSSHLYSYLYTV